MWASRGIVVWLTLACAVACGGAVSDHGSDGGAGTVGASGRTGSSSSGGGAGQAFSEPVSNPFGGSAASGGSGSPGGATGPAGGATGSAGGATGSAGHTSGSAGSLCKDVKCVAPACDDGVATIVPLGLCCPVCDTPDRGCENVECQPSTACPPGYQRRQPAGACCEGCVPIPGAIEDCAGIACPDRECPLGYRRGDLMGGCCDVCVPNPNFCNYAIDCLLAESTNECCADQYAYSIRAYKENACLFSPDLPRPVPADCSLRAACDDFCSPSLGASEAVCTQHQCQAVPRF